MISSPLAGSTGEGVVMAIPDYQTIMLPLLRFSSDGSERSLREAVEGLAEEFGLSDEERRELLPSGRQPVFENRVGWARTYLVKAGLLKSPRRGHFQVTSRGLDVLRDQPAVIDTKFLTKFPEFREFRERRNERDDNSQESKAVESKQEATPEESLEQAFLSMRRELAADLLDQIKAASAELFEKTVVRLLVNMGYGGDLKDAGQAIGRSGDEGIDGIIKEDRLGLDIIYVQAKRWQGTVGRPEIQKFAGALQGKRAKKGVFLTTSDFSKEAREYAGNIESKIVLIDGESLAKYMIEFNLAVTSVANYEVKRLDMDFFAEE